VVVIGFLASRIVDERMPVLIDICQCVLRRGVRKSRTAMLDRRIEIKKTLRATPVVLRTLVSG
jgi:hypothetical protein